MVNTFLCVICIWVHIQHIVSKPLPYIIIYFTMNPLKKEIIIIIIITFMAKLLSVTFIFITLVHLLKYLYSNDILLVKLNKIKRFYKWNSNSICSRTFDHFSVLTWSPLSCLTSLLNVEGARTEPAALQLVDNHWLTFYTCKDTCKHVGTLGLLDDMSARSTSSFRVPQTLNHTLHTLTHNHSLPGQIFSVGSNWTQTLSVQGRWTLMMF